MPDETKPAFPFVADLAFQAGDVVLATDRFGRVVHWNKEAEAISGYKMEEVLGKPYTLACRMGPDAAAPDISAILAGRDFAGGVRCQSRSGGDVVLYLFATAGRNPAGEPAGVVFVGRDVTGLWQAEAAAQATADKYQVLFENNLDSVAIADMEGKVLEANPACLQLYGYTVEDVKVMNLTDVVAPEDRRAAADAMANLAAGRPVTKTIRMRRKDGTRFVVDLVASVVAVGGERRIMSVTRDVTERVLAERARSQSERMYRTVFESANDAAFIESVDGRILDVNRHGCELLGYRREELVKMNVSDMVTAEARAWLPMVTDAILRDKTFRTEAVNVHKSGRHIPVEMSASTMELDGKTAVLAIVRDITERKRAEAALAESENRYRAMFDESLMGIYRTAPDGKILMANPALVRMLGYESFAQLAKRNLEADGSGPDYGRDEFKRRLERDGRIVGLEVRWRTRDGRTLFVRENARAVHGQDRAVLYYEGTVEDITDRKAAEQALRESEAKFRDVSEQSPNMIFINCRGRVAYANQKSADVMGYTREEFYAPGFDFMKLIAPESVEQIKSVYARRARGEYVEPCEYSLVTKDGRRIESIITTKLIEYDGTKAILGIVTDITERRVAERALLESERQYRTALDAMHDPVHVADADLRIVLINQAFLRWLTGHGIERAVLGKTVFDAFPFLTAKVREEYRKVFESGQPLVTEEETTVAGRAFFTETTKVPITENDTVVRIMTVVRDTTEYRAAELVLRESEEKYRSVVERASDGICVVQDGRLKYVNRALAEMAGYTAEELVGKQFHEYVHPEDRASVGDRYRRRLAGELVPSMYSVRLVPRGGGEVSVEVNVGMATYDGSPAEIVLVRDVTERRQAEQALQESEDRYRRLLETSPDGVAVHQGGKVVLMNPAGARMLGYDDPAELTGVNVVDFLHPDERAEVLARMRQVLESGPSSKPASARFRRRDGVYVPLEVANATLTWQGKPAIQVVFRDVTERRQAEQALRQEKELAHSYFEVAGVIMVVLDETGSVKRINQKGCAVLGGTSADIVGRNWFDTFVPERLRNQVRQVFTGLMSGQLEPAEYNENPVVNLRGEERLVAWHNALLRDEAGRVVGTLSSGADVTERTELTREVAAAAAQAQAVLDNSPGAIAAECEGKLVYANERFVRLFGYESPDQVVGRPVGEFDAPEDRAALMEYSRVRESGGDAPTSYVFRGLKRDGTIVPLEARISTYHSLGRLHILAFISETEP